MKIQSVQNYNLKNNYATTQKSNLKINNNFSNPSFGIGGCYGSGGKAFGPGESGGSSDKVWLLGKLRIFERTESEMNDLAEYFNCHSDAELQSVGKEMHPWNSEKAKNVANRLIKYVTPIREVKLKKEQRISELETKKTLGVSNLTDQKTRLNREFISLIAAEKEGKNPPIDNGILVHGASKDKDNFIKWLTESAGAVVKTIQHDTSNPTKTVDALIDISENAERAFKHSKTRTMIIIDDLDKMLTNKNSAEAMDNINEFKSIAEDLSQRYHTTIITKTDKPLDAFEPATIASNRLGIHVNLKEGLSVNESKELEILKSEIERLNNKASELKNFTRVSWWCWPERIAEILGKL